MEDDFQFESVRRMGPDEFARWVEGRPASDLYHYELLDGHVVMTPPAGHPHGLVGSSLQCMLGTFARSRDRTCEGIHDLRGGRYGKGQVYAEGERVRSEILAGLSEDVSTLVAGGGDGVPSET